MHKKAQLVSIELIVSIAVFMVLIVGVIIFWNIYSIRFNKDIDRNELAIKLVKISDTFVENQGFPTAWNETNVQVIGLVNNDRTLNTNKLSSFKNVTYSGIKAILNIDAYDFYFRIIDLQGATVSANGQIIEIGSQPGANEESVITIRRFLLYGSKKVIMEFSIWK